MIKYNLLPPSGGCRAVQTERRRRGHAVYRLPSVLLQGALRPWAARRWSWGPTPFNFSPAIPGAARAKDLDPADAAALRDLLARHGFGPIVAHAPYTLNLCGAEEKNRIFARETMADDLARLEHVPGQYYNFHPGSHVGQGSETGIALIADGLNAILRPDQATTVLLETMAGKGSEVGGRFEELRAILDRWSSPARWRLPGHLPRVRRRIRHRPRPGRRADRI